MLFTTSWDDGHPLDLRLADLLHRRGFNGTFYVPISNREGLPVMSPGEMRQVDASAELGSHTLDHCYLTTVDTVTARAQIRDGRERLQDALGHSVAGFCYPGGKFGREHYDMVRSEGFTYARTTANFHADIGTDCYLSPTSLQFYPHSRQVYLRNWIKHGQWTRRARLARIAVAGDDLADVLRKALLEVRQSDGVFHLWGHSWEFDAFGGWKILDEFLAFAADHVPARSRVTNMQALVCTGRSFANFDREDTTT